MKSSIMMETQSRKNAAVEFLRLGASGMAREAFSRFVAEDFRHHNPHFPGDAHSLAAGMAENAEEFPNMEFEVKHVLAEGDLVAVHSRARLAPDRPIMALAHWFRFEGDRIVELWDIAQPAPENSPNRLGMF